MPKLRCAGVSKSFGGRRGRDPLLALDGIDLELTEGEMACVVGASGCGKSTLLNIVAGLDSATSGVVEVDGEVVVGPGPDRGVVFQAYSLYPWKSVRDNIAFGLQLLGTDKATLRERTDELLGIVGLDQFADALPKELSGGMRQRVAIARALAPEPDLLLLDEPFGALDAQTKRSMQEFLLTVRHRTSATVLMVTHDVDEAVRLGDTVHVFSSRPGRVAEVVDVPFGTVRGPDIARDPRFLDLRDEIQEMLHTTAEPVT